MKIVLAVVLAAALLGSGGTVVAANGAVPGDALYAVDQAAEQVRFDLASAPESRAALKLAYAEERLLEARDLVSRSDADHAEAALLAYDKSFSEAVSLLLVEGMNSQQALALLDQSLAVQAALLAEIDPEAAAAEAALLQQGNGGPCSDGDGDGFADEFPLLPCVNGEVTCTDADANGLDDTYTGLACAASPQPEAAEEGEQDIESEAEASAEDLDPCDPGVVHPVGQRLAAQFGVSYETIMGHFCAGGGEDGFGFGQIRHAYRIAQQSGVSVDEVFALHQGGMGWGEIRQQYGVRGNNGQGRGNGQGQGGGQGQGRGSSADPSGQAERIAAAAGVSVDEVMALRESGMGWGQIRQQYGLIGAESDDDDGDDDQGGGPGTGRGQGQQRQAERIAAAAGVSVDEVMALRQSGMGWGEIKAHYGLINADDADEDTEDEDD